MQREQQIHFLIRLRTELKTLELWILISMLDLLFYAGARKFEILRGI